MLVSWRNFFSGVVNTAFHVSRETLRDKILFSKKTKTCLFFPNLNEENPDFWQKFSRRVSTTKSTSPEEHFEKTFFGRRYNFGSFHGFSEENLICQKISMFIGKAFRVSSGTFWGRNFWKKQSFSNFCALR